MMNSIYTARSASNALNYHNPSGIIITMNDIKMTDETFTQLFNANRLKILKYLNISGNLITDQAVNNANLWLNCAQNIQQINLSNNKITSASLLTFSDNKFSHLGYLNLSSNNIGKQGVKYLIKSDLPELLRLGLKDCKIGSEGTKIVIKGYWPKLKGLTISAIEINIDGINDLIKGNWKQLNSLHLGKCEPTNIFLLMAINWKNNLINNNFEEWVYQDFKKICKPIIQRKSKQWKWKDQIETSKTMTQFYN